MPARLIINADDFGLTPGINRAIAELHAAGVVTSATLMANGPAFGDAVAIAHAHPTLSVGCHIVLTDGAPLAPPADIPTLLGPDGRNFRPSLADFVQAVLRGVIMPREIELESSLQIQKLQAAGIRITHLDTHKHTHLFPAVLAPLRNMCEAAGIPAIRNPFEPRWSRRYSHPAPLRRAAVAALSLLRPRFLGELRRHPSVATTDGTLAISATGRLTAETLRELLAALPATGTFELCCHPGYHDPDLDCIRTRLRTARDTERVALLSEMPGHSLIAYRL